MEDVLAFDGKKLSVQAPLPEEKSYLRQVYDVVEKKQPVKFENVIEYFSFNFTDKYINRLIEDIGESLAESGCVRKEQGGFMNGKTLYIRMRPMWTILYRTSVQSFWRMESFPRIL